VKPLSAELLTVRAKAHFGTWPAGDSLGHGIDYFAHHLSRARHELPGGAAIPFWLVWLPPIVWLIVLLPAGTALRRAFDRRYERGVRL